jgi:1,2-diacylglycerol 3-beta-glucosyltransferase
VSQRTRPDRQEPDPKVTRVLAGVVAVSATTLGCLAARRRLAAVAMLAGAVVGVGHLQRVVRAGRTAAVRSAASPPDRAPKALPAVTVIVPARDEARVIGQLVADVAAQDHRADDGTPRFDLVVVDDGSTDGTGDRASESARRHAIGSNFLLVRRDGSADGPGRKGAALGAIPPESCRGEVIVVLDADARIGSDFVRLIAQQFATGVEALTASRRMVRGRGSPVVRQLALAQDEEQLADGRIQAGRWALGGCSELRGNGMALSRSLLCAVGGWPDRALAEDLELSARIAARTGLGIAWVPDVVVWEEPVRSLGALFRQRARWAEGSARRYLLETLAVLRSPTLPVRSKVDFGAYGLQTVMPLALSGLLAGSVAARNARLLALLAVLYGGSAAVLAMDAVPGPDGRSTRRGGGTRPWIRVGRLALFGCHWLAIVPFGWWRLALGPTDRPWDRTTHAGMPAGWRPLSAIAES